MTTTTIDYATLGGWSVSWSTARRSGTYHQLARHTPGELTEFVTVKARFGDGPAFVCLECKTNACEHIDALVSLRETGESA